MDKLKFSVVIPYKQRLDNLRLVLASLADQTLGQFEVVIGAMEYSPEFVALCREYTDRLNILSVLSAEDWNLCRARNLAIPNASGQVILILDADIMLPPGFLRNLYDRYYAHGQNICVLGQMIGYDEAVDTDADTVELQPYSHYRQVLAELEEAGNVQMDDRWSAANASAFARFPWAFARGGLVAVPAAVVREHGLSYDEGFRGWGPEDQEWALRVAKTGTPIMLGQNVYALHLPHVRSVSGNGSTAQVNNRYYLAKWPRLDLELALAFGGWLEADRIYPDVERELAAIEPFGVRREGDSLDIGASGPDVLPLTGFTLPYQDKSIKLCRILPPALQLSARYREAILREAERVATKVV